MNKKETKDIALEAIGEIAGFYTLGLVLIIVLEALVNKSYARDTVLLLCVTAPICLLRFKAFRDHL